ncbi:protein-methionine-sulfoxide reductase heme-binding subunit MsrQ [Planctobacterium marinum]|uniref:protein-methionine-sulfoxide reductase heme-binding subunit MsrQ n=1 Tax=Planctobacterium marinum TaxID=1631968 RepID=UPI001E407459|nr:protein-methionine-sulfoxide reductase heme-binding subunit MsrQ [Planctobacterium marinum]MCC2604227.1 protein-methionine-sulfoxide reductase heme-binding subunit MsrQ [Planctobacterium marinum]
MILRVTPKSIVQLKIVIHVTNLAFILTWYYWAFTDALGADPVKALIHFTGMGAINLLLLTLLVSPIARFTRQPQWIKIRRLLGLYSFTWAVLHLSNYVVFDLQLAFDTLLEDIIKRPYITVGFSAFLILTSLAVTSPRAMQRTLGKRWQKLHNLIYPASLLVILHFIWSVKSFDPEPILYALLLLLMLSTRFKVVQQRLFSKSAGRQK